MAALLRSYGVQTDIYFPMVKRAVVDLAVTADWTPAAADARISKDGAASAQCTNTVAIASGTSWKLTITATEMQAKQITIQIVDAATKAVEDQFILIETFADAASQHPGIDWANANTAVDNILKRDMSSVSGEASRSLLNVMRAIRNRWKVLSGTLTVYKEDDTTSAWTAAETGTGGANPITESDPT